MKLVDELCKEKFEAMEVVLPVEAEQIEDKVAHALTRFISRK